MEQFNIEVLVSGDIAKSKAVLQQFVTQVYTQKSKQIAIWCAVNYECWHSICMWNAMKQNEFTPNRLIKLAINMGRIFNQMGC